MTMRASRLLPLFLAATIPIGLSWLGCGSSPSKGGNTGGDEDTGGSTGSTGGKTGSTGGKSGGTGGAMGGSGGAATGGSGDTGGAAGGAGGSATGGSGDTGGSGGAATGGSGGAAGGSGGAGGSSAPACGMGRTKPTNAIIDNFDGMSQVLEWLQADDMNTAGTKLMPMGGMLKLTANGKNNYALGALAPWAASSRPCKDGSSYMGIQFNVTGNVTSLIFRVVTPGTLPLSEGGICTSATLCEYAHYQKDVSTSLPAGGLVKVPWGDLKPAFGAPAPFDKTSLVSIVFWTKDTMTTHSFTIDNVAYY
jgi:hypothetical protein